jgi:hypothetical protein
MKGTERQRSAVRFRNRCKLEADDVILIRLNGESETVRCLSYYEIET